MKLVSVLYIWGVVAAGAVAFTFATKSFGLNSDAWALAVLGPAALAAEGWGISLYGDSRVSVSFTLVAAAAIIGGFPAAALVALAAALGTIVHNRDATRFAFNAGALVLAGSAMGAIVSLWNDPSTLELAGIVTLAATANYIVNSSLVAVVVGFSTGRSPWSVWREKFRWLSFHYTAFALMGLALAQAYWIVGASALAIFAIPVVMQRLALGQYIRRTEEDVRQLQKRNVTIEAARMQLEKANHELAELAKDLERTYDGTLVGLVSALDARDSGTRGHSERVGRLTASLAEHVGVRQGSEEWITIFRGALLHDIGKIGIRDAVLLKPAKLTPEEQATMRGHAEIGYEMIRHVPFLSGAAAIVRTHHERVDGLGYPRGLTREQIPLGTKLFGVADAFDAMMSDRPYRKALSLDEALAELQKWAGSQFDPEAVEGVLQIWETWVLEYPGSDAYMLRKSA
jgi:putative nucleotidyltransferase with HDIG domain